jgi:hypothetical protein
MSNGDKKKVFHTFSTPTFTLYSSSIALLDSRKFREFLYASAIEQSALIPPGTTKIPDAPSSLAQRSCFSRSFFPVWRSSSFADPMFALHQSDVETLATGKSYFLDSARISAISAPVVSSVME